MGEQAPGEQTLDLSWSFGSLLAANVTLRNSYRNARVQITNQNLHDHCTKNYRNTMNITLTAP